MKKLVFAVTTCLLLALLVGMGSKGDQTVENSTTLVTTVALQDGAVLRNERPLVVSFSADMVDEKYLGQTVAPSDMPFKISPEVEGTGQWISQNTFAFSPTKGYPFGTKFYIILNDKLKSLDGKPARYYLSFNTDSNYVQENWVRGYDALQKTAEVALRFRQPIYPADLTEHLKISFANGASVQYTITNAKDAAAQNLFYLQLQDITKEQNEISLTVLSDQNSKNQGVGLKTDFTVSMTFKPADAGTQIAVEESKDNKKASSSIYFQEPYTYTEGNGNIVANVYLSEEFASHNQDEFIEVTPKLPYTIGYRNLRFSEGLEPGTRVVVSMLPGFVDRYGAVVQEKISTSFTVPDRSSFISFNNTGSYLTPVHGGMVALDLCNVSEVQVTLYRQYDNNLPLIGTYFGGSSTDLAKEVFTKRFPVDLKRNEIVTRGIDLNALTGGKNGVYTLQVTGYVPRNSGNWLYDETVAWETQTVVLSDLGLTSRVFPTGISVFLAGIANGKPVADADVAVFSRSNQLIAQGKTDASGILIHQRTEPWAAQLSPAIVVAKKGNDISFLTLDYSQYNGLNDTGTTSYLTDNYEAFVFTPRGIFRPGETVDVKAFVRDKKHMPPAPFPVVMRITSASDIILYQTSTTLSEEGGAALRFDLPASAAMGTYTASIAIPGQENTPLGSVRFAVENFIPPRLEVGLTVEDPIFTTDRNNTIDLQADYLFGAPGANLNYHLGYIAQTVAFTPAGFDGYTFGSRQHMLDSESNLTFITGSLDEAGASTMNFVAPENWDDRQAKIKLNLAAEVQEDGGRWVSQYAQAVYFPQKFMLGLKITPKDPKLDSFDYGKPMVINVVAVDPLEKQVTPAKVTAEVFYIEGIWNTVLRNGRYVYDYTERQILQQNYTLDQTTPKRTFEFTPKKRGHYRVRCVTEADGATIIASKDIYAWGYAGDMGEEGTGRLDQVEVSLDKTAYLPGDVAKVSIKSPFQGTLFFGVEHTKQLEARAIALTSPSTIVEVPITAEMSPNATVTAWVVRGVEKNSETWLPHRAYGNASIVLDSSAHALEVTVTPPERVAPGEALTMPFEIKDKAGNPVQGEFAVAFIDEGVLSLTNFKTPNPLSFFFAKRYATGSSYDIYSALMRPVQDLVSLLKAGGDSAALNEYFGSLSTQIVYLVSVDPTVLTNAEGKGEAHFEIPEYSGRARLMIVGSAQDKFASAEASIRVGRDLVVEVTSPPVVAPGDVFRVHLKAFSMVDNLGGKVSIRANATGPLELTGDKQASFNLDKKGSQVLELNAKALQSNELATMTFDISVSGRSDLTFSKTLEVVVRSPYSKSSGVASAIIKEGESALLEQNLRWDPNMSSVTVSVSQNPVITALPALKFLLDYPHRCAEQEVSRTWPYLYMTQFMRDMGMDVPKTEDYDLVRISEAVRHMISLQNSDGGFSMWSGGYISRPWVSVNATFFLLEVKDKVPVPKTVLDNALRYTRSMLFMDDRFFGSDQAANTLKAYAAFVLTRSGQPPLSWLQVLSMRQNNMLPSGRIFLAAAKALHSGNSKALVELEKDELKINWDDIRYNDSFESKVRNTALRLLAWTLVDPANAKTSHLSLELAKLLNENSYLSTQEAGVASLALGRYLAALPNKADQGQFVVFNAKDLAASKLNDQDAINKLLDKGLIAKGSITGREPVRVENQVLAPTKDGTMPRLGVQALKGNVFASYVVRGLPLDAPPSFNEGVTVTKRWLDSEGQPMDIDHVNLNKGDRVWVEIVVSPESMLEHFIMVDMLPGGMEIENPRFSLLRDDNEDDDGYYDRSPEFIHQAREDRMVILMNNISYKYKYVYSLRAITSGNFALPGLAAEAMYDPAVQAQTPSGRVSIK